MCGYIFLMLYCNKLFLFYCFMFLFYFCKKKILMQKAFKLAALVFGVMLLSECKFTTEDYDYRMVKE